MKRKRFGLKNLIYPLVALAGLMLFWFLLSLTIGKDLIIPSPSATFQQMFLLLGKQDFYVSVGGTLWRSVQSFALSVALATFFALLGVRFRVLHRILSPIFIIAGAVPTMSIILLSIIWLQPAFSPIFTAFLIAFPMLYQMLYQSLVRVDPKLIEMSKVYAISKFTVFTKLYVPSVAPSFLTSLSATASLNVKIVISAEVLATTVNSIGQMMYLDKLYLETASLLAWTIVAVVLSCAFDGFFRLIKYFTVRWER